MQGNETDIATQFASNQYSSSMVLVLIVEILIMVVDRVLYSTHAFLSGNKTNYDASPAIIQGQGPIARSPSMMQSTDDSFSYSADESMLISKSGQPYGRKSQMLFGLSGDKDAYNKKNNWIEE